MKALVMPHIKHSCLNSLIEIHAGVNSKICCPVKKNKETISIKEKKVANPQTICISLNILL
jgi:hypothetical protein